MVQYAYQQQIIHQQLLYHTSEHALFRSAHHGSPFAADVNRLGHPAEWQVKQPNTYVSMHRICTDRQTPYTAVMASTDLAVQRKASM